jgi:hypothetical protein
MFRISNRVLCSIVASVFVFVGCDKTDEAAGGDASALGSAESVLRYVAADTPYVLANVESLPDELMDKLEPKLDRLLQSYQVILREIVDAKRQEFSTEGLDSEEAEAIDAVIGELMTLLSIDGMRDAGIGREATGAIYGNGLLPVLRLQLTDGALFDSALARFEEKAGQALPVAEVDGHSYRYFDADKIRILIAVIGNQAVITMVPSISDDAQTAQALGLELPNLNIAEAGVLQKIAEDYDFTNHYVGFLDVKALVEPFVGTPTGMNAVLLGMGERDAVELSDTCRAEIRAVAGVAPRMVMGYNEISVDKFDSTVAFELRDDIAAGVKGLTAAVPGLGGDKGGLMSFGMSFDVKALRAFVEARLEALEAAPFECEYFAQIQGGIAGAKEALQQPVPPMIYDFKGFLAVIDKIEGLDLATQTPPTSIEGSFLLAMDNAQALVSMGALMSPDLAALNLQSGGDPVALDIPQLQSMGIEAFAALSDSAIAISIGEGAESSITDMLDAGAADPSPLFSFSVNAARYYGFLGEAIAAGDVADDDAASPEMQAAMQEVMLAVADIYDRMSADVLLTSRGVELRSSVTLKD